MLSFSSFYVIYKLNLYLSIFVYYWFFFVIISRFYKELRTYVATKCCDVYTCHLNCCSVLKIRWFTCLNWSSSSVVTLSRLVLYHKYSSFYCGSFSSFVREDFYLLLKSPRNLFSCEQSVLFSCFTGELRCYKRR